MDVANGDENQPSNATDVQQSAVIDKTVQQMTHGFVALFEKELDQVQYSLKEALSKQEKMGVELERMNAEHTMESRQDCQELFYMVRELTDKLHLIKKRMLNMHQRVKHLKKRSESLLKHRDREINILRQKQLQEEDLIAKPVQTNPQ
ncbi:uncharacterized protein LOC129578899 [Sitodiplosis mosellana]|uniref:uncharacterized protein LOC129578899 n=1 Tax=Sitodiplosis mosellana TaxID=263140 RepID=UPI002443BA91|nr:uncharacterized protein LOC129578899 [Sitodiplosis mosellana]